MPQKPEMRPSLSTLSSCPDPIATKLHNQTSEALSEGCSCGGAATRRENKYAAAQPVECSPIRGSAHQRRSHPDHRDKRMYPPSSDFRVPATWVFRPGHPRSLMANDAAGWGCRQRAARRIAKQPATSTSCPRLEIDQSVAAQELIGIKLQHRAITCVGPAPLLRREVLLLRRKVEPLCRLPHTISPNAAAAPKRKR